MTLQIAKTLKNKAFSTQEAFANDPEHTQNAKDGGDHRGHHLSDKIRNSIEFAKAEQFRNLEPLLKPDGAAEFLGVSCSELKELDGLLYSDIGGTGRLIRYSLDDLRKFQVKTLLGEGVPNGTGAFPRTTYFIGEADRVPEAIKIGFTAGPVEWRLTAFQTAHHRKLRIWAVRRGDKEALYHGKYGNLHIRGDWFRLTHALASEIRNNPVG